MKVNRGILALVATVLVWGSTFVISKAALADLGPLTLSVLRFAIAYVVLLPLAHRRGYRVQHSLQPTFLSFGLTGIALYFGLQNVALQYTSAVSAVLVIASVPAVTAVLASIFLKERLTKVQLLGIALALFGAAMVALGSPPGEAGSRPILGGLLIFGAGVSWGFYTVQGKRLISGRPAIVITAASTGAGIVLLAPLALAELVIQGVPGQVSPSTLGALLYLGVVVSGLTMVLWNYALATVQASVAGAFTNLVPVVGVIIALVAGETIHWPQIAGGIVTLVGVWLSNRRA